MPKHVDVTQLVMAISRLTFVVEASLLRSLLDAINHYQAQVVQDESIGAELWRLFNEIDPKLRTEFSV